MRNVRDNILLRHRLRLHRNGGIAPQVYAELSDNDDDMRRASLVGDTRRLILAELRRREAEK